MKRVDEENVLVVIVEFSQVKVHALIKRDSLNLPYLLPFMTFSVERKMRYIAECPCCLIPYNEIE